MISSKQLHRSFQRSAVNFGVGLIFLCLFPTHRFLLWKGDDERPMESCTLVFALGAAITLSTIERKALFIKDGDATSEQANLNDKTFAQCKEDLNSVQVDNNKRLFPSKYVDFIRNYSHGGIDVSKFRNLPLALVMDYHSLSCSFCDHGENEPAHSPKGTYLSCCEGERKYIPTKNESNRDKMYLLNLCTRVESTLKSLLPSRTWSPTSTPTSMITSSPLKHLTHSPSNKPTSTPTGSQYISPTKTPLSSPTETITIGSTKKPTTSPITLDSSQYPTSVNLVPKRWTASPAPTRFGRVDIGFSYGARVEGIDASALWSGSNPTNTIKEDLTVATRIAVENFLGESDVGAHLSDTPVIISNILDDKCLNPPAETERTKCIYVKSTVSVYRDENEDPEKVKKVVINGLQEDGISLANFHR